MRSNDTMPLLFHALAFVYLAGLLGALWSGMKPVPALVFLVPLAAHAVASALRAERAQRALGAFCFWIGVALASTVGAYAAAVLISPPVSDGHPVMPIGQVIIATFVGPLLGGLLAYLYGKRVEARAPGRDRVIQALFVVLLVIAVYRAYREWS